VRDGDDLFIVFDGVKIAKRGRPDTPHAKTWISLEPEYVVRDLEDEDEDGIVIEHNGVQVH
jgi:hypothetical protein